MTDESPMSGQALERYRRYLAFLARLQVGYRFRARLDLSGIVQQTLWEACQNPTEWTSLTASQQMAFLRRVLAHNVCDEVRKLTSDKRDVHREESLDRKMDQSSRRLWKELACDSSSPSRKISRSEQALQLAAALDCLPEAQREALILQHWEGLPLTEIAAHMNRTPAAVAGLLKRGLQQLRATLGAVM
ncbi:MAG: sigma-70 family RNA polymerase sigma factor [Planctomycetes bacterium]|nr:sigma-70 family RNA polymerase sigma factor [Planctomycetota bacterium]